MTIMYLTFGQKTEYHLQAYLSMLSFRRQMTATDHVVMVTTAPEFYRHAQSWADVVSISDDQVRQWQGDHQFFWRAKIKAIEYVGSKYPDDDLLYLDCDTVLLGSIDWLRQHMANGQGLMDRDEGHPMNMKTKTLRMWKTIAGRTYGGITLGEQHHMYCAGVVGIPQSRRQQIVSTALALCDGMLDDDAERIVIEQYSLSVALFEHAGLTETKDCIAHYWATKDEWMQAASELIARVHLTAANADDELRLFDSIDWHALPVYAHKSSTARRLRRLIDKAFPDRDQRYIKG
jgi:hypothetical protein